MYINTPVTKGHKADENPNGRGCYNKGIIVRTIINPVIVPVVKTSIIDGPVTYRNGVSYTISPGHILIAPTWITGIINRPSVIVAGCSLLKTARLVGIW